MKIIAIYLVFLFLCPIGVDYCHADQEDADMLGDTALGGLLGAGAGAAIGSASGNAGKGALVGAGVGAIGGALLSALKRGSRKRDRDDDDRDYQRRRDAERDRQRDNDRYEREKTAKEEDEAGSYSKPGVKRKVVREYDEDGNVISENEVYYEDEE